MFAADMSSSGEAGRRISRDQRQSSEALYPRMEAQVHVVCRHVSRVVIEV